MSIKTVLLVCLAAAVIGCASRAKADIVDPHVDLDPTHCGSFPTPCGTGVTSGQEVSITVPGSGGGTFKFTNMGTTVWHSLILTETGVAADAITCTTGDFGECNPVPTGSSSSTNDPVHIIFDDNNCPLCIGVPQSYFIIINLNDPNPSGDGFLTTGSWPVGQSLDATFNPVITPEPATMLLVGTGLAGAILKRRKK